MCSSNSDVFLGGGPAKSAAAAAAAAVASDEPEAGPQLDQSEDSTVNVTDEDGDAKPEKTAADAAVDEESVVKPEVEPKLTLKDVQPAIADDDKHLLVVDIDISTPQQTDDESGYECQLDQSGDSALDVTNEVEDAKPVKQHEANNDSRQTNDANACTGTSPTDQAATKPEPERPRSEDAASDVTDDAKDIEPVTVYKANSNPCPTNGAGAGTEIRDPEQATGEPEAKRELNQLDDDAAEDIDKSGVEPVEEYKANDNDDSSLTTNAVAEPDELTSMSAKPSTLQSSAGWQFFSMFLSSSIVQLLLLDFYRVSSLQWPLWVLGL